MRRGQAAVVQISCRHGSASPRKRRGTTSSSDRLSPPDPKGSGPSALCLKAWEIPYECKLDLPHPPAYR